MAQQIVANKNFAIFPATNVEAKAGNPVKHLSDGIATLPQGTLSVRVLEGRAWITVNNDDIFIYAGQQAQIPNSKQARIISALRKQETVSYVVNQQ